MSTVEEAVEDVTGLHSKIDRKKTVETQNELSFEDFKDVRDCNITAANVVNIFSFLFWCVCV